LSEVTRSRRAMTRNLDQEALLVVLVGIGTGVLVGSG
jgi:hypothetical protein